MAWPDAGASNSTAAGATAKPLAGLKVVELARILAGPWVGQTLADLGADVIKIESPDGDDTRGWGPPWIGNDDERTAAYFHCCNRGKRSVIADLKQQDERDHVVELASHADVFIENFRVGGLAKYGLDAASLRSQNSRLVYCSITGFGQDGPYANRAGYDFMIQGMAGIMSLTGEPDGEPQKTGVAFADIFSALYATNAIQAALAERERTGVGAHVDMALFDCMSGVLANQAMNYLATGTVPTRLGNRHPNIAPYRSVAVSDGHAILAVGNDGQFARLVDVLGVPELASDERFTSNALRVENSAELDALIEPRLLAWQRDELLDALEKAVVPAGPINTVADVFADEQFTHRRMRVNNDGVAGIRTPIVIDGKPSVADSGSPSLGQHGRVGDLFSTD
jgi:crotonobetainyl-CoA:carnitine CoA-transferase CaiB-like acyl-CoA transferase